MTRREFVRRVKNYANKSGEEVRVDPARGKGSHSRVYLGSKFTTVQKGDLSKGVVAAMLKQLGIDAREF